MKTRRLALPVAVGEGAKSFILEGFFDTALRIDEESHVTDGSRDSIQGCYIPSSVTYDGLEAHESGREKVWFVARGRCLCCRAGSGCAPLRRTDQPSQEERASAARANVG